MQSNLVKIERVVLPAWSLMATTMVRVEPSGTMPVMGLAHGPFPFWISIQQSTLSPDNKVKRLPSYYPSHKIRIRKIKARLANLLSTLNRVQYHKPKLGFD